MHQRIINLQLEKRQQLLLPFFGQRIVRVGDVDQHFRLARRMNYPLHQQKRIGRKAEPLRKDLDRLCYRLMGVELKPIPIAAWIELPDDFAGERNLLSLLGRVVRLLLANDRSRGVIDIHRIGFASRRLQSVGKSVLTELGRFRECVASEMLPGRWIGRKLDFDVEPF